MKRWTTYFTVVLATFTIGVASAAIYFLPRENKTFETNQNLPSSNVPPTLTEHVANEAKDKCREDKEQAKQILIESYDEYQIIKKHRSIEKLVALDGKLRKFFDDKKRLICFYDLNVNEFYDDKYQEIGIHAENGIVTSDKLLAEAHQINPRSKYRKYTLYPTIFGNEIHGLGLMPNIEAAYNYEREFPDGPFIKETLTVIADFNKDLYMVLRDNNEDYKRDCYKLYISKTSRSEQAERARRKAISYYRKLLGFDSPESSGEDSSDSQYFWEEFDNQNYLEELSKGSVDVWSFCGD